MVAESSGLLTGDHFLGIPGISASSKFFHLTQETNGSLETDIEAGATAVFNKQYYYFNTENMGTDFLVPAATAAFKSGIMRLFMPTD